MMPSIDENKAITKNTEIIGINVGVPIKTISGASPINNNNGNSVNLGDRHQQQHQASETNENPLIDNKITINPSSSPESSSQASLDQTTMNNGTNLKLDENFLNEDRQCGWFNFKPKCLERFMSPKWALFWLCCSSWNQGLVVNGFINVVITTIERRFGLRSSQTGLVASGYDIASFLCLVPVSYFGGRAGASKPKWIGWGVVIMGIGSFVFALPHFLVGSYRTDITDSSNVCNANNFNGTTLEECSTDGQSNKLEDLSWNVWLFFLAQLLHGTGASPLYTLGVTYIDENVSKKMSSVYLAIYYTMATIGPACGYVVGGQLLKFYTDFMTIDPVTLGLTPQSKVWVGGWWIGFVIMSIVCFLLAIPILAYPKSLPGSENLEKTSEAHGGSEQKRAFTKPQEIPKALTTLLKNPTFFFLNLAGATEGLIISGFAVFLPKQIENQFSVTAVYAALLMGLTCVPAGGGGTFLGGYLVKKLKLSCSGIIKFCLVATSFAALFTICFLLSCPNVSFAGVTTSYSTAAQALHEFKDSLVGNDSDFERFYQPSTTLTLENQCNRKCGCSAKNYEPICGADGLLYYSPCYAGCSMEKNLDKSKVYQNCDCIINNLIVSNNISQKHSSENSIYRHYDAVNMMCDSKCNHLGLFVSLCFFVMFFTFLSTMPALSATLRCVHDDQRSFALGIQWIKVRMFGTIPAPIIFGRLIDESCILWQDTCDNSNDHGSCLVYDNKMMSRYMLTLALMGKLASILFFFLAWFFYIPPKVKPDDQITDEKPQIPQPITANGNKVANHDVEKY